MALRNQPYLPLYVQDFLTDEKLIECSASATGVYIRIMCIMHKSDEYGTILLKQKDKQKDKQINNFALKLARHMPYSIDEIEKAIIELIEEKVLMIEEDKLIQKRMVKDNHVSEVRSKAGKKGGDKTHFAKAKTETKHKANTEDENINEDENENEEENEEEKVIEEEKAEFEKTRSIYPGTKRGLDTEYNNFKNKHKDWKQILTYLNGSLLYQIEARKKKTGFVPEWANFSTWINQRKFEEEIPEDMKKTDINEIYELAKERERQNNN